MSAQPVDVLAGDLRRICGHDSRSVDGCVTCKAADRIETDYRQSAAVAELVRRADDVLNLLEDNEAVRKALAPLMPDTARGPDHPRITKLRAALARIAPNELHDKAAELRGRGE